MTGPWAATNCAGVGGLSGFLGPGRLPSVRPPFRRSSQKKNAKCGGFHIVHARLSRSFLPQSDLVDFRNRSAVVLIG